MVRVLTIGLMLIYALSATGASVHLHYCCGQLQKIAMEEEHNNSKDDKCALCLQHEEKPSGDGHAADLLQCTDDVPLQNHCHDVQVDAQKTTGDHLPGSDKSLLKILSLELPVFVLTYITDFQSYRYTAPQTANAPPPGVTTPLFIQHCTYRI